MRSVVGDGGWLVLQRSRKMVGTNLSRPMTFAALIERALQAGYDHLILVNEAKGSDHGLLDSSHSWRRSK